MRRRYADVDCGGLGFGHTKSKSNADGVKRAQSGCAYTRFFSSVEANCSFAKSSAAKD